MWKNFLVTAIIFVLSIAIFYTTIINLDPLGEQKIIAYASLFLSFFCGITAFFIFVFFFASELIQGRKLSGNAFNIATRRALLVALFFTVLLGLQLFRLFGIFETVLLAIFISLVEYTFISMKRII